MTVDQRNQTIHGYPTNVAGAVNTGGGLLNTGRIDSGGHVVGRDLHVYHGVPAREALHVNVPTVSGQLVGRDELIEQIVSALCRDVAGAWAITGLPGVGKTALAMALANHPAILAHFADGVLWASLGPQPDITAHLQQWAAALGQEIGHLTNDNERAQAVKNAVAKRHLLIVIDDTWDEESARLLQGGGQSRTLLTTRNLFIAERLANIQHVFRVPVLDAEAAMHLLSLLAPKACASDAGAVQTLVQQVGYLPLAIRLLGAYLAGRQGGHRYFAGASQVALHELTDPTHRIQLAQARLGTVEAEALSLQNLVELSLQNMPEPVAVAFYHLGAFAAQPANFTLDAALVVTELDSDALTLLLDAHLLEIDAAEQLSLHQTIADVARARLATDAAERHRTFYLNLVNANRKNWRHIKVIYAQIQWIWANMPDDGPLLDFIEALHRYQQARDLPHHAEAWLMRALELPALATHLETKGKLLNLLGLAYNQQRKWSVAITALQESIALSRQLNDAQGEAGRLNNLGSAYKGSGQLAMAMAAYNESLQIKRHLDDRFGIGRTLHNLALGYIEQEQWVKAHQLLTESLQIKREVQDRSGEGATLRSLGDVYAHQQSWEAAMAHYQKSLDIRKELGEQVAESNLRGALGSLYAQLGQYDLAIEQYTKGLEIPRALGRKLDEGRILNNLGLVYQQQGQWQSALECFEESLLLKLHHDGPDAVAVTLRNLAHIYRAQQMAPQAAAQWTNVLNKLPPDGAVYPMLGEWVGQLAT